MFVRKEGRKIERKGERGNGKLKINKLKKRARLMDPKQIYAFPAEINKLTLHFG